MAQDHPGAGQETSGVGSTSADDARPPGRFPRHGPGFGGIRPARVLAGLLLAVGIVVPLAVPTYASDGPRLWGFPFFYWYQLAWVFGTAILVGIAFVLLHRDETLHRDELTGGARLPDQDALLASEAELEGRGRHERGSA